MKFRLILFAAVLSCAAQQNVNPHSAVLADFADRINQYMKIHKEVKSKTRMKPTGSPAAISAGRAEFARLIREARPNATQGAIFTPPIAAEFRRLVALTMQGSNARHIRESLHHAEPVRLELKVNEVYPENVPLQSTPATLLLNLPELPPGLDYRLVGHDLVLRDVDANLIVDFAPGVLPD